MAKEPRTYLPRLTAATLTVSIGFSPVSFVAPVHAATADEASNVADMTRINTQRIAAQQAIMALASEATAAVDADGDSDVEPPAMRAGTGPAGGGLIPLTSAAPKDDSYGSALGYCAWDNGTVNSSAGRITGAVSSSGAPVVAIVAPGVNNTFQTSCADIAAGTGARGDDYVVRYTTAELRAKTGTLYYGDPVPNLAALNALPSAELRDGEVRLVKDTNILYRRNQGSGIWEQVNNVPTPPWMRGVTVGARTTFYSNDPIGIGTNDAPNQLTVVDPGIGVPIGVKTQGQFNGLQLLNPSTGVNGFVGYDNTANTLLVNAQNTGGQIALAVAGTPYLTLANSGLLTAANGLVVNNTALAANAGITTTTLNTSALATLAAMTTANASITGGSINGTPIGNTTPSTGTFTTLAASGTITAGGGFVGDGSNLTGFTAGQITNALGYVPLTSSGSANLSGKLAITGGDTIALTNGAYHLRLGNETGANIVMDPTGIQARSNGSVSTLVFNPLGGLVAAPRIAIGSSIDDGSGANLQVSGGLNTTGNATVGGNLAVAGTSTLTGNTTIAGTLGVTGATTLTGALTANGGISSTTGAFSGNTSIGGTLGVTGTTTLTGALTANGGITSTTGTFSGAVSAASFSGNGAALTNLDAGNIVTGTLAVARGGTGLGATPTNGQLLIGNGTGYTLAGLTAGTGMTITNGSGTITITNAGVTSFNARTGAVTLTKADVDSVANFGTVNFSLGTNSMTTATTGTANTAVGASALGSNTTGNSNVAVGRNALASNTSGFQNTAVGQAALYQNTTGGENSAFGEQALATNTTGNYNSAFGSYALRYNTTGYENVAVGREALTSNTTGTGNTSVGSYSMTAANTGDYHTAIGHQALRFNTTGQQNTALGTNALINNTTGGYNVAVGMSALQGGASASSSYNTAVGHSSTLSITTGTRNAAVGYQSLYNATTGYQNSVIGDQALYANTTGNRNVAIGVSAGYQTSAGTATNANTTGSNNTFLGSYAMPGTTTQLSYATAIGADSLITSSNTVVLGRTTDVTVIGATGDDGSGNRLQVTGGIKANSLAVSGPTTLTGKNIDNILIRPTTMTSNDYVSIVFQDPDASTLAMALRYYDITTLELRVEGGALRVGGAVYATAFNVSSDARFKKNVRSITNALDIIGNLKGMRYEFDHKAFPDRSFASGTQVGFLAQQIEPYVPELVSTDSQGYKSVQYGQMVPLLVEGIKEQQNLLKHFIKQDPSSMTLDIKTFHTNEMVVQKMQAHQAKIAQLEAENARIKKLEAEQIESRSVRSDVVKSGEISTFVPIGSFQPMFTPQNDAQYIVNAVADDGSVAFASVATVNGRIVVTPVSGRGVDMVVMGNQVGLVAPNKQVKATWLRMS